MSKSTRLCAAAMLTALMIGPAFTQSALAQMAPAPGSVQTDEQNDEFNWGLLGLLGLAGLAPLFMKKDREGNVHPDTRR
ncbi:WGxxGxxG family protein [Falsiroseomonas sp. E2-1-a20]|uniref:WGxxGxxG family protein n=1 Tax=Falsiroseomonas sp. E2-1-a20 TaxID=3239300 RepID=UPI003F2ABBD2